MKSERLHLATLRMASWLAPEDQRVEWLKEWRAELWCVPRRRATRFCLGAFRDALWLRRNNLSPVTGTLIRLDSPLECLAFLAGLAAVSLLIAVCLSGPLTQRPIYAGLRARDLPAGCAAMLGLSCLLLPGTLAVGRAPANRYPMPWPGRLRRGVFLVLKFALLQPIILAGFMVWILIAPVAPFSQLGILAAWILALRWVFTDQRSRCPVCLRLLSSPVRIGTPSETFLEWYGAESICSRGHGLLQVPEVSSSYSPREQWLRLDGSWDELFSEAHEVRHR